MLNDIIAFFETISPIQGALLATVFTWLMTMLGASVVLFTKNINRTFFDGMLGFTGGVMLAASFWSLLTPAIAMVEGDGLMKVMPIAIGFSMGAMFIFMLDKILPHLHINFNETEGIKSPWQRTTLLVLAITLHNIPEGLAIGVLFGGVLTGASEASISGAVILALGIGIQNIPEGAAVSMPLRRMGMSRLKSFNYGQGSALVEPISAVIGAAAVSVFMPVLPYALAFAAGAMIFVVIEEVIPETQQAGHSDVAALGFLGGFLLMMTLDLSFG